MAAASRAMAGVRRALRIGWDKESMAGESGVGYFISKSRRVRPSRDATRRSPSLTGPTPVGVPV